MKKVKLKKKYRLKVGNLFTLIICLYLLFISFIFINKNKFYSSNEEYINSLLYSTNSYKHKDLNYITQFTNFLFNSNTINPVSIIEGVFNYNLSNNDEEYNPEILSSVTKHMEDPNPKKIESPIVYIYNSHQLENYSSSNTNDYNVNPNVMTASYILKEKLNSLGISSIVEEGDITEFIRLNNWNYNYSYLASRYYINAAKEKYTSLRYYIDIHRDSLTKNNSTSHIYDKNYATILFVVGLEHANYKKNLDLALTLNNRLNDKYPSISKGVLKKEGPNVNGIYNQDIDPNLMLIEIGGYENTIEEVTNTLDVLSIILKEYINEHK